MIFNLKDKNILKECCRLVHFRKTKMFFKTSLSLEDNFDAASEMTVCLGHIVLVYVGHHTPNGSLQYCL